MAADLKFMEEKIAGVVPYKRHENAAGKRLCGMCSYKVAGKGVWKCTVIHKENPDFPPFCPAPDGECDFFVQKPRIVRAEYQKPARLKIPPGVRFLYFGQPRQGERHQGVMTVAYILGDNGGANMVAIGIAFCNTGNPKKKIKPDIFSKKEGQREAMQKLFDNPITAYYLYSPRRLVVEISQALLERKFVWLNAVVRFDRVPFFNGRSRVPSWSRDLAKRLEAEKFSLHSLTKGRMKLIRNLLRIKNPDTFLIDVLKATYAELPQKIVAPRDWFISEKEIIEWATCFPTTP